MIIKYINYNILKIIFLIYLRYIFLTNNYLLKSYSK